MLTVLLCGAGDTKPFAQSFSDEVRSYGGEPWFYQSGDILYSNTAHADWKQNSSLSVEQADLCVFVLVHEIGRITWDVELATALKQGKPFLLLCLEETYHRYLELTRTDVDRDDLSSEDRALHDLLHRLDATLNLTAVPFAQPYFRDVLRTQMSNLLTNSLRLLQQRNQRDNVLADLRPDKTPSEYEQRVLTEIALDETEFVQVRKRAILALAAVGVAEGELRELVNSPSQAVARLVIGHLDELLQEGTDLSEFLSFCVMTVNDSDDVGLVRRLIVKILVISLPEGLRALGGIDLTEIGARRRLAMVLGERESDIRLAGLQQEAVDLLARCLAKASEDGWIARGRALLERLSSSLGG